MADPHPLSRSSAPVPIGVSMILGIYRLSRTLLFFLWFLHRGTCVQQERLLTTKLNPMVPAPVSHPRRIPFRLHKRRLSKPPPGDPATRDKGPFELPPRLGPLQVAEGRVVGDKVCLTARSQVQRYRPGISPPMERGSQNVPGGAFRSPKLTFGRILSGFSKP